MGGMVMATVAVAAAAAGCIEERTFRPPDPEAPTVPVLRLPQNDAYEGSTVLGRLQPKFVWEPSMGGKGDVRYELQYSADKEFPAGTVTVPVNETSHRVVEPLPVSTTPPVGRRYYWRVRACAGETCSEYSKPWWVNLGRSIKDFNGDGYDDVVVSWHRNTDNGPLSGRANIYFGGPGSRFDTTLDGFVNDSAANDWFAENIAAAGDFNGDGFGDVLVGANQNDRGGEDAGAAYLYFGGAGQNFNSQFDVLFVGDVPFGYFGSAIAGGKDLNGDGFSDVAISASGVETGVSNAGCVRVFFGSADAGGGRKAQAVQKLCGTEAEQYFGLRIGSVGDLNGDGFSDLSLAAKVVRQGNVLRECTVVNFYGGPGTTFDGEVDGYFGGEANENCSLVVEAAGDVNADGFSDGIAVAGETGKGTRLFLGGKEPDAKVDMFFNAESAGFIARAGSAGDVNGDGIDDIMFGEKTLVDLRVNIHLGLGADGGTPVSASEAAIISSSRDSYLGYALGALGDTNGDGFDDVGLGDAVYNDATGRVDVYFGNSGASIDINADGSLFSGAPMSSFGLRVARSDDSKPVRLSAARRGPKRR